MDVIANVEVSSHTESPHVPTVVAQPQEAPIHKIFLVASIAIGIQFIWALQLTLLTPYVQMLGVPHKWVSLIWLCGPISGMVVQPLAGYYSDTCITRFGRRRPFIIVGTIFIIIAILLIGFALDIGHATGDLLDNSPKHHTIIIFIVGFWVLDLAINMLQGPCRAFLGDLSSTNSSKMRTSNAAFALFISIGSIFGYASSSFHQIHKIFPFTITDACNVYCANLKTCFFISMIILTVITSMALIIVKEPENHSEIHTQNTNDLETRTKVPFFLCGIYSAIKDLHNPMWVLLLVLFLNIFAWSSFSMYNTDWIGREVYGGNVKELKLYNQGLNVGSLGLMIQAIVGGVTSLGIQFFARGHEGGLGKLWGGANILLAICMCLTVLITKLAESSRHTTMNHGEVTSIPPEIGIKIGVFALFGVMGIPLAVTYSVPYALASIYSSRSGAGQGLSVGVLNLASVIPQLIVSVLSGQLDTLFVGDSNLPTFLVGAFAAAASGIVAIVLLPTPPPDDTDMTPTSSA